MTPDSAQNESYRAHLTTFGIFTPLLGTSRNRRIELRNSCEDSLPAFSLVKAREEYYRKKLIALVDEDLFPPPLNHIDPSEGDLSSLLVWLFPQ